MPYMLASSVVVISTERAQRKQRMISIEAMGRSRLARTESVETSESDDDPGLTVDRRSPQ
ncbi:hypothetical protein VSDG_07334 [Cytospora chrysosperma]|uniref:Uncharacterized protein n=1 Tax=Cytospora chrysosperma TaxID=252740 RepID=A0A423VPW2_CYTCH|nr:hypothetical protein VSDG_07334 [Valsa sordida]